MSTHDTTVPLDGRTVKSENRIRIYKNDRDLYSELEPGEIYQAVIHHDGESMRFAARIGSNWYIRLGSHVREALGIKPGDIVDVELVLEDEQ